MTSIAKEKKIATDLVFTKVDFHPLSAPVEEKKENERNVENESPQKWQAKKPQKQKEAEPNTPTQTNEKKEAEKQTSKTEAEKPSASSSGTSPTSKQRSRKPNTNFREELTDDSHDIDGLLVITNESDLNKEMHTAVPKKTAIDQELLDSIENDNLNEIASEPKKNKKQNKDFDIDSLFKDTTTKGKEDNDGLNIGDDFAFDEYIKKQQT
ncbi:hypothetical protein RFI_01014 [Reticulomyxa filosa]|uniref:Uncharacterized protein n=1 Tax=Reticulomyxa filosa TaxID=46433 RepID=X6PD58_RETFI|nr:hypothetical protein RFI_01014 [Reticulomyxa filosa]|eukprot:ETO36043.1 hypothetical protein RFI_01014 [Reticulomyxa filosa]